MNGKFNLMFVGALALGLVVTTMTGCVDEEASVVMHTNVIGSGEFEPGDPEAETEDRANCEFPADFDEPNVWASGSIDLAELDNTGQPLVSGTDAGAERWRYMFRTVVENRLSDSRQVGSVSGGEGDGFQNMALDKNDILIKSADVALYGPDGYQDVSVRRGTMLVQSGGGVAAYGVPLIDGPGQVGALREAVGEDPQEFIAEVQLHGERLAGAEVESNVIEYPLVMCDGCDIDTNPQCQLN